MRRRGAEGSHTEAQPFDEATLVFSGSIGDPKDSKGLKVEISRSSGEVVMRTDKAEIGRWPVAEVTIRRIDTGLFEFIAEADHLVFAPDDASVFGASPLITVEEIEGGRRKLRKAKKKPASEKKEPPSEKKKPPSEKKKPASEKKEPPSESSPRVSRKKRKAGTVDDAEDETAVVPPDTDGPASTKATSVASTTVEESHSDDAAKFDPATIRAESGKEPKRSAKGRRSGPWIMVLDIARRNRLLGFDRVPINLSLRGGEHEHTWDHRVAPRSGPASHICTICGKIKF